MELEPDKIYWVRWHGFEGLLQYKYTYHAPKPRVTAPISMSLSGLNNYNNTTVSTEVECRVEMYSPGDTTQAYHYFQEVCDTKQYFPISMNPGEFQFFVRHSVREPTQEQLKPYHADTAYQHLARI